MFRRLWRFRPADNVIKSQRNFEMECFTRCCCCFYWKFKLICFEKYNIMFRSGNGKARAQSLWMHVIFDIWSCRLSGYRSAVVDERVDFWTSHSISCVIFRTSTFSRWYRLPWICQNRITAFEHGDYPGCSDVEFNQKTRGELWVFWGAWLS